MATDSQNSYTSNRDSYTPNRDRRGRGPALTVVVGDRGIEQAMRVFKKLILKEGLLKDLKRREHYEKPGDRKRRKQREAVRRRRRQAARTRGRGVGER
jgi:small subunit ribosomal protein S21